jgi:long-subunit acyl-CoA synthetase (AMP-forming)
MQNFNSRLRLGDLGLMDEDGFLIVLGRLDEFITLSSGEVISPLRVSF